MITDKVKLLDESGLKKVFKLLKNKHYTKDEVDARISEAQIPEGTINGFLTKDEASRTYAEKTSVYTKTETDGLLGDKANDNEVVKGFKTHDLETITPAVTGNISFASGDVNLTKVDENTVKLVASDNIATKSYVDGAVSGIDRTLYKVITKDDLDDEPEEGDENKIHLVPTDDADENNEYDEYIYQNGKWELIGSKLGIDLDDYVTSDEFSSITEWKDKFTNQKVLITDNSFSYTPDQVTLSRAYVRLDTGEKLVDQPPMVMNSATPTTAGVMSASDKVKLNSINVEDLATKQYVAEEIERAKLEGDGEVDTSQFLTESSTTITTMKQDITDLKTWVGSIGYLSNEDIDTIYENIFTEE